MTKKPTLKNTIWNHIETYGADADLSRDLEEGFLSNPPPGKGRLFAEIDLVLIKRLAAEARARRQKKTARLEEILEEYFRRIDAEGKEKSK